MKHVDLTHYGTERCQLCIEYDSATDKHSSYTLGWRVQRIGSRRSAVDAEYLDTRGSFGCVACAAFCQGVEGSTLVGGRYSGELLAIGEHSEGVLTAALYLE